MHLNTVFREGASFTRLLKGSMAQNRCMIPVLDVG